MAHCEVASGDYESIPLAGSDDVVRQVACRAEGLILTLFTARVGLMIHAHPRPFSATPKGGHPGCTKAGA